MILAPKDPLSRTELHTWLLARDFVQTSDDPVTDGVHATIWRRDDDGVLYQTWAKFGTALLKFVGPAAEQLAAEFSSGTPTRSIEQLLTTPEHPTRVELLRHTYELAGLMWIDEDTRAQAKPLLFARLGDDDELVRWAAVDGLLVDEDAIAPLQQAAAKHAEMGEVLARLQDALAAQREGTLGNADTDDRWELLRRAREGAAAGQWRRVAKAMDVLLADSSWDEEAWFLRGLAHAGEGEPIEALLMLGAVVEELTPSDDDELDDDDDDEYDELDDELDDDDDELDADKQQRLATAEAELARLRPLAEQLDADARTRAVATVMSWLETWTDSSQVGPIHGAATALHGVLPELDGVLLVLLARWQHDPELIERARRALPDAPSVLLMQADALADEDPDAAAQLYADLRKQLREGAELSETARKLEDLLARAPGARPPSESSVVERLTRRSYDEQDWDRAAELADELVALDPDCAIGWQIRANAHIFALRHELAVDACSDAITNLERIHAAADEDDTIFLGTDPRATMYFNRACVLAKLGRRELALDDLREAIRRDAQFAEDAPADDYFEALFDDPEFLAICAQDAAALVTDAERSPLAVQQWIARTREHENTGDLQAALTASERAVTLAQLIDAPDQLAEALGLNARMHLFLGEIEPALARSDESLALLDRVEQPRVRASVWGQRGVCMQALGRLNEAEAAFAQALELRRTTLGDTHPDVVKSMVALAGLATALDAEPGEIEARVTEGIDRARRCLNDLPERDHIWAEVIDGLVSLLVQRALLRAHGERLDEVAAPLELAVEHLEQQQIAGYTPRTSILDELHDLASTLAPKQIGNLLARIEALLLPGPPAERRARLAFHRLRRLIQQMRLAGVQEREIANLLGDIVRGGDKLDEQLRNLPALVELRNLLARASARESTILVTSAMALELAGMPGRLDESLDSLEELIVPIVSD